MQNTILVLRCNFVCLSVATLQFCVQTAKDIVKNLPQNYNAVTIIRTESPLTRELSN